MLTKIVNGEAVEMTVEEEAVTRAEWASFNPSPQDIIKSRQAALETMIQQHLDSQAQSMNFDNIISGISNASLPVGEYRQADGAALLLWRARTWKKAAEIRDAYLAGGPEPTWAEVEAQLPDYPIV